VLLSLTSALLFLHQLLYNGGMQKQTLFISDLHLQESAPQTTDFFMQFMATQAPKAEALYILGDFFEYWIGDDDHTPFHQRIIAALRQLSDQGVSLYFMPGNRDFLIGDRFAQAAGLTRLKDPHRLVLYGDPVLLSHGDSLCTRDKRYQAFRKKTQNPYLRWCFLHCPLTIRRKIAAAARRKSQQHTQQADHTLMDVTPAAVHTLMQGENVTRLIHGHTHRPYVHKINVNNRPAERIVLGAWHRAPSVLTVFDDGRYTLTA
jgi:UDP-2,3-diacylglucosamine hydrolase